MEKGLMELAFKMMLDNSKDMIFLKDINLVYRAASMPFARMVGKSSVEEMVGHTDNEVFEDAQLAARYVMDDRKIIASRKDMLNFVEPITDEDGRPRYGSTSKYLVRDEEGEIIGLLGVTEDITTEYIARQQYQQELRYLFELPADVYAVCYIDVDDWRVIKQRRKLIDGGTVQEGQTVEEICMYAVESIADQGCEAVDFYRDFTPAKLWGIFASGRTSLTYEYERQMSDGSTKWVQNDVNFIRDIDSGHLCVMLSAKDIHEAKMEEMRIINAAKLDQMTKVLNRETAMEYIRRIIHHESDRLHVLFMLDVDNFKSLNDTLGHQVGDEFLIKLAAELKHAFRDSDVVGRIGGDEFFIFLRNVAEVSLIEKKAREILDLVQGVTREYLQVDLSGSVGISLYPGNGKTLEDLYASADKALYQAKHSGKNRYVFAS